MKRILTIITMLALGATVAQAELLEFKFGALLEAGDNITNTTAHAVAEEQFRMVLDTDTEALTFYNIGTTESVLTDIFFDEGGGCALVLDTIVNSTGVFYEEQTVPPPLTDPQGIGFSFTSDIVVNPSGIPDKYDNSILNSPTYEGAENVSLEMSYDSSFDLLGLLTSGDLRVVTKLQGYFYGDSTDAGSEYFVNGTTYEIVPEPASLALLVGSSALIGFIRKRFIV